MRVVREKAGPIQLDGEVVDSGPEVRIEIRPRALRIRVPPAQDTALN